MDDTPTAAASNSGSTITTCLGDDASTSASPSDPDDRVFLVPYRWWREAREKAGQGRDDDGRPPPRGVPYAVASQAPSSYGMKFMNLFASDLVFNLRKDDESMEGEPEDDSSPAGVSGRSYALVPSDLWVPALKRQSSLTTMENGNTSWTEDGLNPYPLTLRISVMRETNILNVKISKKDNTLDTYKRASKLFSMDSEPLRVWDFSGQTYLILMNEWNKMPHDCHQRTEHEIPLEIQVCALSDNQTSRKDDSSLQQSKINGFSKGDVLARNGSIENIVSLVQFGSQKGLGLTGLENLGNTCFMNSAIQCLAHTPMLVDYFLGDYSKEINHTNSLGMKGELALAFGDLLRRLWALDRTPVFPRSFKSNLARFAPQFSGFNQHDSQELLAFLLDGLHEDLNRVKNKPYIEFKDEEDLPDEEVAEKYWGYHLARNNSVIVDICQGQYRSKLVCPVCNKVSITFDPFMYLSLPLPSTMMRTMTITVFSTCGGAKPSEHIINVPKAGKLKDLIQGLRIACSLGDEEDLLIAEVYANRIIRFLEEPSDSISLIRDEDRLAAYRLTKDMQKGPLVVFVHQRMEEYYLLGGRTSNWKSFGVPLLASLPDVVDGSFIKNQFLKLLEPHQRIKDDILDHNENKDTSSSMLATEMEESSSFSGSGDVAELMEEDTDHDDQLHFHLTDEKCQVVQCKIEMNDRVSISPSQKHLYIVVRWQKGTLEEYDSSLLNTLTEVHKFRPFLRKSQETSSLYSCLEAFIKEEPLGPEDMWYCPRCKKHQQASKKLDLWRLPEVLVIHLKRFSYSRYMKNKLETLVDFPIHDLDLSTYIVGNSRGASHHYRLYAISNHYGNMGGGHYTAYVYHGGENRWYDFDDRSVTVIYEESIKTPAAYVLFYRRI